MTAWLNDQTRLAELRDERDEAIEVGIGYQALAEDLALAIVVYLNFTSAKRGDKEVLKEAFRKYQRATVITNRA